MSDALSPPTADSPRRSSRSPRRRKRNKGKKELGQEDDDTSSRASSASPSPSPSPARVPAQSRTPSSALSKPPLNASATSTTSQASSLASSNNKNVPFLSRTIEPKTSAVSLLRNSLSAAVQHVQPVLLLAYFYARFPSLVADPISAMSTDALVVTILQTGWCFACLPPYAGNSKVASKSSKTKSTPSRRIPSAQSTPTKARSEGLGGGPATTDNPSLPSRLNTALLSLPLTVLAAIPVFVLLVLFGAPLTTHIPHTALLALHVSLLGALPLFYVHGVDSQAWWEIAGMFLASDAVAGSAAGACVGCWLGAIPIPLDWDREWQKWPVTIVTGAYIGSVAGRYIGQYIIPGKRLKFEVGDD